MRKIRIYQAGAYSVGEIIPLSATASQHVGRVLRMNVDDLLVLFNGSNNEYPAKIIAVSKRLVTVQIQDVAYVNRESNLTITLAQAISKGDKMDLVIQKSIELGVTAIVPILSERCVINLNPERLAKKHQQWQDQAIAACEQCGRNIIPTIHETSKIQDFIHSTQKLENQTLTDTTPPDSNPSSPQHHKFILFPGASKAWHDYEIITKDITILIGPEGGLSPNEIELAQQHNFQPVSLGPRILRTETAAIATISILQALFGDI